MSHTIREQIAKQASGAAVEMFMSILPTIINFVRENPNMSDKKLTSAILGEELPVVDNSSKRGRSPGIQLVSPSKGKKASTSGVDRCLYVTAQSANPAQCTRQRSDDAFCNSHKDMPAAKAQRAALVEVHGSKLKKVDAPLAVEEYKKPSKSKPSSPTSAKLAATGHTMAKSSKDRKKPVAVRGSDSETEAKEKDSDSESEAAPIKPYNSDSEDDGKPRRLNLKSIAKPKKGSDSDSDSDSEAAKKPVKKAAKKGSDSDSDSAAETVRKAAKKGSDSDSDSDSDSEAKKAKKGSDSDSDSESEKPHIVTNDSDSEAEYDAAIEKGTESDGGVEDGMADIIRAQGNLYK